MSLYKKDKLYFVPKKKFFLLKGNMVCGENTDLRTRQVLV